MNFVLEDRIRNKDSGKVAVIVDMYSVKSIYSEIEDEYVILKFDNSNDYSILSLKTINLFYKLYKEPGKFKIV